jgi:predicted site-specific integrase-resolvase
MGIQQGKPLSEIPKVADDQILISREQARVILGGVSYMTICRWEQEGKLTPIKMSEGVSAKVFYLRDDITAVLKKRRKPSTS